MRDPRTRFWACPADLEPFDRTEGDLIPECKGLMSAPAVVHDFMDGECRALTY